MATNIFEARGHSLPARLNERGYHVVYRDHQVNNCPGCGRSHWLIGRLMAECAFCETALPLEAGMTTGTQTPRITRRGGYQFEQAIAA